MWKDDGSSGDDYTFWVREQADSTLDLAFDINTSGGAHSEVALSSDLALNTWYHVASTYDGTNIINYVDGNQVSSEPHSGTLNDSGLPIYIGARPVAGLHPFPGYIDDVRIYDRALSGSEITDLYNLGANSINFGLVGHWPMDDASGNLRDLVNGNDGVPNGGNFSYQATTPIGIGVDLSNDVDADFGVGNPPELQITGPLTVSTWVEWTSTGVTSEAYFVNKRGSVPNRSFRLRAHLGTDEATFNVSSDGSDDISSGGAPLTPGEWYHIVGVYEPSTRVTLYLNGVNVAENTTSIPASIHNTAEPLGFGGDGYGFGGGRFEGKMDDLRIYNRALSDEEVSILYACGSGAGSQFYNFTSDVQQWCDQSGAARNMGPPASGSGACGGEAEGTMQYVPATNTYQFCDGNGWVNIGK